MPEVALDAPVGCVVLTVPELGDPLVEVAEVPAARAAVESLGSVGVAPPTLITVEIPPVDLGWCLARAGGVVEGDGLVWVLAEADGCAGAAAVWLTCARTGESITEAGTAAASGVPALAAGAGRGGDGRARRTAATGAWWR